MDMREHIASHAAGFNARVTSLGLFSRILLIAVAALVMLLFVVLAIPLLVLGFCTLLIRSFWLRVTSLWRSPRRGEPAPFRGGLRDDEGRQNVRVRIPDDG